MSSQEQTVKQLLALADIKINGNRPLDIQVHDERFYKRVLSKGELGLGEAYMDGWWSSNQLDETTTRLLTADLRHKIGISWPIVKAGLTAILLNNQRLSRAYKNAGSHYNIGNDLYQAMLGSRK